MKSYKLWINGQWTESKGGGRMAIENPATREQIAEVTDGSRADVDTAVTAAREAFYDGRWSRLTPSERSLALWRLGDLLEKHIEQFARAESENTGKPYGFVSLGASERGKIVAHRDARLCDVDAGAHALEPVHDDDVAGRKPLLDDAQAVDEPACFDGPVLNDALPVDDEHEALTEIGTDRTIVDERRAVAVRAHELHARE